MPDIEPRPHTRLSPSMMGRVEACTASFWLTPDRIERESNEYAARGTVAHEIAEQMIADPMRLPFEFIGEVYKADGFEFEVDQDLIDLVMPYVEYCQGIQEITDLHGIESRVQLPQSINHGLDPIKGLIDFHAIYTHDDRECDIEIVDLKTGRQYVDEGALQLALYGIMMVYTNMPEGVTTPPDKAILKTTVVQPKAQGEVIRSKLWYAEEFNELLLRVNKLLDRIRRRDFNYEAGDHCRFCPVLGTCPHVRAVALDAALTKVAPQPEMIVSGEITADDLDDMLAKIQLVKTWESAIVDLADKYLHAGGQLQNAKLVRKRTQRKWRTGTDPVPMLELHGVDPYKKTLISPTQAEKALPKGAYAAIEPMVEKPVGDLTVAIGDDRRAAVNIQAALARASEQAKAAKHLEASNQSEDAKQKRKAS